MSENLTSPDSIASSSSSLPQGSATPSAPVQPQESKRGPSKYEVITHDHISSEWTTPIKHSQIPETLFKTRLRAEPVDALETTGFSRSSPSTQNAPRIANDFLQSLIDRRPKDARFNVPFIKMLSPMVRLINLVGFSLMCASLVLKMLSYIPRGRSFPPVTSHPSLYVHDPYFDFCLSFV